MNVRTKYILGFLGICFASGLVMLAGAWYTPRYPVARFVPLIALVCAFVAVILLVRRFQNLFSLPTTEEKTRAIRAHRRIAWIYIAGLLLALATEAQNILPLPHGLGFVLLLIPIGLAANHFRMAAALKRGVDQAGS